MESTNIKTSTIKFIEEDGTWNNGEHTFYKYKLHLNNGEKPEFLAKSQKTINNFKVGDTVRYEYRKNSDKYAKLVSDFNKPNFKQMANTNTTTNTNTMTQQESIARSVAWNNVSQFIFTEEFQKYDDPDAKDKNGNKMILSERQLRMIDQAAVSANIIYKQLLIKPE